MKSDSLRAHPALPQVSDGGGTDVSPSDLPPNLQVIAQTSRHFCNVCGDDFAQKGGLSRHIETEHEDHYPCLLSSCDFTWTRPYLFRYHLESCHRDVDADKVLGKRGRSRRKSNIIGRDLPLPVSPPAVESDGQTQAEHLQISVTTPLPTGTKVTHSPSPAPLSVAQDSQSEHAGPAVTWLKHKDTGGLGLLGPTDDHYAFWSTERVVKLHEEVDSVIVAGAKVYWMPSAHPGEFTTYGTHLTQVPSPNPAFTPPGHDSLVFADPMVDLDHNFLFAGCHDNGTGFASGEIYSDASMIYYW